MYNLGIQIQNSFEYDHKAKIEFRSVYAECLHIQMNFWFSDLDS